MSLNGYFTALTNTSITQKKANNADETKSPVGINFNRRFFPAFTEGETLDSNTTDEALFTFRRLVRSKIFPILSLAVARQRQ